jgi:hypothetical protein
MHVTYSNHPSANILPTHASMCVCICVCVCLFTTIVRAYRYADTVRVASRLHKMETCSRSSCVCHLRKFRKARFSFRLISVVRVLGNSSNLLPVLPLSSETFNICQIHVGCQHSETPEFFQTHSGGASMGSINIQTCACTCRSSSSRRPISCRASPSPLLASAATNSPKSSIL